MAVNTYIEGMLVRVSCTIYDFSGRLVSPTNLQLAYVDPSGGTTTWIYGTDPEIVLASIGSFYADLNTTGLVGTWSYVWSATGNVQSVGQAQFVTTATLA